MAVLCHGFTTSKDGRTYISLEEKLNAEGLATFRFDLFGHGESQGRFEDITVSEAVDDVESAILFIKSRGFERLGLMGSSFGGLASLLAASSTNNLLVLALKSPVSDYAELFRVPDYERRLKDWRERGSVEITGVDGQKRRLNFSFYDDAIKADGYEAAQKIAIPTLIVHGDRDETVPVAQSLKTAALIPDCRLDIIPGADHVYSDPDHFETMLRLIHGYVKEHLQLSSDV